MIGKEIKSANHAGSLMRSNSMASKLMKSYSFMIGKPFLRSTLLVNIEAVCKGQDFEVDPNKVDDPKIIEKNREQLQSMCSKFVRTILDSIDTSPVEFREICSHLQKEVTKKFPGNAQLCIGGFLFLRFFCPAIMTPVYYGILSEQPDEKSQRGLTLIAKALQNVANNVTFGNKVAYLDWLNAWVTEYFSACQDYFDEMARLPKTSKVSSAVEPQDKMSALNDMYLLLVPMFSKIQEQCQTKPFFERLQIIMEKLKTFEKRQSELRESMTEGL